MCGGLLALARQACTPEAGVGRIGLTQADLNRDPAMGMACMLHPSCPISAAFQREVSSHNLHNRDQRREWPCRQRGEMPPEERAELIDLHA